MLSVRVHDNCNVLRMQTILRCVQASVRVRRHACRISRRVTLYVYVCVSQGHGCGRSTRLFHATRHRERFDSLHPRARTMRVSCGIFQPLRHNMLFALIIRKPQRLAVLCIRRYHRWTGCWSGERICKLFHMNYCLFTFSEKVFDIYVSRM